MYGLHHREGAVHCGTPKARPLKCDLKLEEGGPSGKCAKMGDVIVIESDSELEWVPPWEDLQLHVLEYLSMQMRDQMLLMEWGMQAMEVIAQMAVSTVSIMWEWWAAEKPGGRVDHGMGPEEPALALAAEKGPLFVPEALED